MSSPPNYREYSPGARLADAIECFWTSSGPSGGGGGICHRVLPDGCMDVLFDFSGPSGRSTAVIGTMTQALLVRSRGAVDLLGVRFRPGGLAAFLACDAAELTDGRAELTSFWGASAAELWERLAESGMAGRIRLLREFLEARASGPGDLFIQHCVRRIEAVHGDLRMAQIEKSTGLTLRQIERKFSRQLGISPKMFARVVRFGAVTAAAKRAPAPDWGRIAADLGFADQPHLTREFKAFAGLTPVGYHAETCAARADVGFLQDVASAIG